MKVESDEKKDSNLKEAFRKLEMTTKRKIIKYCIKYGLIEACINTKSAFLRSLLGEGEEKAYILYARENAKKYGRPLKYNDRKSLESPFQLTMPS